jgi:hypothetical protein
MKKNDIFLANAVINIIAGAGLIALGVIGTVSWGKRAGRHVTVRRAER